MMREPVADPFSGIERDLEAIERVALERSISGNPATIKSLLSCVPVVYSDVDGTLTGPGGCFFLNAQREYTLESAQALVRALRAELDIVLVSGRTKGQLFENARFMGLRNYIAELGTETVYDLGEETVINAGSFGPDCTDILARIVETGVLEWLEEQYPGQLEPHLPWAANRDCTPIFRGLVDLTELNLRMEEFAPGLILLDNGVIPWKSPTLRVSHTRAYHLMPRGVTKELAVARDMERRGFERHNTIAIGDAEADLAFAAVVGVFFLVRNGLHASPRILEQLPNYPNVFVTEHFLNEGWAEVINLLIDEQLCPS